MNVKSLFRLPAQIGYRDHVIGGAIGLVYVVWLLATARSLGFPRDEGFYFHAASDYARWFRLLLEQPRQAMLQSNVDGMWNYNHEHPALMKSLFALSWMFLHEKWRLFQDASTAFRFPAMLMAGMSLYVTYLFGARAYGRTAGVVAAILFACQPNVFFHAHLACFDIPIVAMWLLCIYAYWRSTQEPGLGWAIACGFIYGLTLETKHNAWILPAVFVPHAIFISWRAFSRGISVGRVSFPASLVAMAIIGPIVFFALWPWMWADTLPRLQEYVNFHLHHEYYNIEFLHETIWEPPAPKLFVPVMILATVPTITVLLFLIGAGDRIVLGVRRLRAAVLRRMPGRTDEGVALAAELPRDRAETDLLVLLAVGAAIGPFFLSKTPIFGGTKHFMTAFPFLAILAGHGFSRVATILANVDIPRLPLAGRTDAVKQAITGGLVAIVGIGPLVITAHSHPFGLCHYVPIVGGVAGGADLGLYRQFWGYTTQSLAPWLAENAPPNATIFIHDTAGDSWTRMVDEKRIRPDLRPVWSPTDATFSIVHYEQHMLEQDYQNWMGSGTSSPADVLTHDGVPIISVYRKQR